MTDYVSRAQEILDDICQNHMSGSTMTKAEARQYIIDHCNSDYPQGGTKWDDAMNMAIKALEESEQTGWIPDSKPPTENGPYLVWMPFAPEGHHITVTEWCGSYWNIKTPITKWARLPEPYKEANDGQ